MAKRNTKAHKPAPRAAVRTPVPNYIRCVYKELLPAKSLKPNPANPNYHPEAQLMRFAEVLKFSGVRKPIVVSNQTGMIVTGHGTLRAMQKNGWDLIPVDYQDFADYGQEFAHIVADNALQAWSELDKGAINAQLENLGPELNLQMLGLQDFVLDLGAENAGALPAPGGEENWEDPVQSATVRKITLFYSAEVYGEFMKSLLELSKQRETTSLSDLVAQLVREALAK